MSSPAQLAANLANAQHSTGPRTPEGKEASSRNATKLGLFSTRDFIRPGEESIYAEMAESLQRTFAPVGDLESALADEIRRAMWRLRRCGETEAAMVDQCIAAADDPNAPIPDAMQIEATAKLQLAVDRARVQSHRLLHKCTAELRKLQTDRFLRLDQYGKNDISFMGLADLRVFRKAQTESVQGQLTQYKANSIESENRFKREFNEFMALPPEAASTIATPDAKQTHDPFAHLAGPARNARCACGSGRKFKHCCALKAVA